MSLLSFTDLLSFSNQEISEAIVDAENQLFKLRLKKATRQKLKSHEIKKVKHRIAQLKTLLTLRLQDLEQKKSKVN